MRKNYNYFNSSFFADKREEEQQRRHQDWYYNRLDAGYFTDLQGTLCNYREI